MKKALEAIDKGVPYRKVEERFNIPRSVLQRHYTSKDIKPHGGQVALGARLEKHLVNRLVLCAEWGYPMDTFDLWCIVKGTWTEEVLTTSALKTTCRVKIGLHHF